MASSSKFAMRALFGVNFYSLTERSSACFDFEVTQMGDNGPRRCGLGYHSHSNCLPDSIAAAAAGAIVQIATLKLSDYY